MTLLPGTKLGPYEIVSPIGAGGMGEVYRAKDTRLGREVAVKVLPASFAADADRLHRFEQEARATGALNHPNILAVYDLGTQDGAPYLVTELLEGETLRERMQESPLALRKALDYAIQIANGLAAAHGKGIVHRDLKPENLFVTRDGRVKILDFGLAKLVVVAADSGETAATLPAAGPARTNPGTVLGTVGYMSPEQVRGREVDHRSDIFSFGAILYEMVSAQRPFRGESSIETMNAILKEEPPEISATNRNVPPALERVIRRCLEKSPDERFQSARDLAFALEALSGTSSSLAAPATADAPNDGARNWIWVSAAGILAVALVAGAYFWGISRGRELGVSEVKYTLLSYQREAIFNARYAPDGETVIYSAAMEGNVPELFIHRPDYPAAQAMGLRDTHLLSVSSKGELAVLTDAKFLAQRLFTGTLAAVALGGGAPREIMRGVREADWSPDGKNLAIIHDAQGKDRLEFPIGKVLFEAPGYLSDLRVSPSGDQVAFFEHPLRYDDRGTVDVVDLNGNRKVLTPGYAGEEGLTWSLDGKEIYFSSWLEGDSSEFIRAVSPSGKVRETIRSVGELWVLDTGKDGKVLLTQNTSTTSAIVLAPGSNVERDMSWLDSSVFPTLSSDAKWLLFSDDSPPAGENYAVCLRKTDGSPVVRLGDGNAGDLSRDGKWALANVPSSPVRLVIYPTGPGEPRNLERGLIENYDSAHFFPDGKRILSCGNEPGHASRCYVQEIAGGPPRAVTPEGTSQGLVSPDGNSILAQGSGGKFSIYPVAGGAAKEIAGLGADEVAIRWTADGKSLLVNRSGEIPARVERLDLVSGKRTPVAEIAPADRTGVLEVRQIAFADDTKYHAYSCTRLLSRLATVNGVK